MRSLQNEMESITGYIYLECALQVTHLPTCKFCQFIDRTMTDILIHLLNWEKTFMEKAKYCSLGKFTS